MAALAKDYERFDAQFYNGLYYPLIDMIEWQESDSDLPHMEFHIHSKQMPVEVTAVPGDSNGKPVLWLMFDLKFRSEKVCRKVIAPAHFREGMTLHAYRDSSAPDYENIYFSSQELKMKNLVPYTQEPYQACTDEMASNKPEAAPPAQRAPASAPATAGPNEVKKEGKGVSVDYDTNALPFSF